MSYSDTLYLILFTTGFTVGFGHCIGMCGPIVVSLSLNLKGRNVIIPQLLYNAGRITTYTVLGGIMGLTGSVTGIMSNIAGLKKGVMIFAGLLIIIMGAAMSGWVPLGRIFGDHYQPGGFLFKKFLKLSTPRSSRTYYPLGLILGLLPCGAVYTALMTSGRVGMESANSLEGFLKGLGLMLVFGLGTCPALLLVGKLTNLGWLRKREVIYKVGSVLMVIVGIYFVIKGIRH
jgi:sulfite exporter TauE/SafE